MILGRWGSLVTYKQLKFVITCMPHACSMEPFIEDLLQYNARALVKTCSGTYSLGSVPIRVIELCYPNGSFPTEEVIDEWINTVETYFRTEGNISLAVHCRYGLGRSAVLVAIALMEADLSPLEVIEMVRGKRRGAFNEEQKQKILKYKSKHRLVTVANCVVVIPETSAS